MGAICKVWIGESRTPRSAFIRIRCRSSRQNISAVCPSGELSLFVVCRRCWRQHWRQPRSVKQLRSRGGQVGRSIIVPYSPVVFYRFAAIFAAATPLVRVFVLLILMYPNPQRQSMATEG
jgi:hypothetical protein